MQSGCMSKWGGKGDGIYVTPIFWTEDASVKISHRYPPQQGILLIILQVTLVFVPTPANTAEIIGL